MFQLLSHLWRYIRLKTSASFVRLALWWMDGSFNTFPDSILQIPSRDPKRTIKTHVYNPTTSTKPSPVLINFHGSGFILRYHGSDDEFCRQVSKETDYTVLDVKYRLAPEDPFPACINDAEDVVNWVLEQPERFDLSKVSISGFSAGGNIALVQSSINFPKDTFRSVLCFYPVVTFVTPRAVRATMAPDKDGHPIPPHLEELFIQCYTRNGGAENDPRVSPALASMDTIAQNVLMITAAQDTLCLEAEALAARIEEMGDRNVVRQRMEKCGHAWDKSAKTPEEIKAKEVSYGLAVQMLKL